MQHTTNYNLNQWDAEDRVTRADFNADNLAIDAALKAVADAAAGGLHVETWTYTGTGGHGQNHPTTFEFQSDPIVFFVFGGDTLLIGSRIHIFTMQRDSSYNAYMRKAASTWNGNTVSFYVGLDDAYQMNTSGVAYTVIGLCT